MTVERKNPRNIVELLNAKPASDGAGVTLKRVFSNPRVERFDPFLMLDDFGSDNADDYIAGFPPHPHRGFETITYMLKGKMEHRDHLGNVGLLSDGGVQWMTAGRGVIHSEMPKQTEGELHGFQLWLNLPAAKKMQDARYQDIQSNQIPVIEADGYRAKAIAGALEINDTSVKGFFDIDDTEVNFVDLHLEQGKTITIDTPIEHNAMVYVYEGELHAPTRVKAEQMARFDAGDHLVIENRSKQQVKFIVLTGAPLNEPIKQYGPFVMNTTEEINQAVQDYRDGNLVA